VRLQPVRERGNGQDWNVKLIPNGLNVAVAADQCIGMGYGSEHQKDDVVIDQAFK